MIQQTNQKKKITIIDYDKSITSILNFILNQYEFETVCINDNILTNFLKSPKPDLILIDQNIDSSTYIKFLKTLTLKYPKIPILGMIGKKIKLQNYKHSINLLGYIYKPFDTEEIIKKIKELTK